MKSVSTLDLWDLDQRDDEAVQEYYGDAEGITRRWDDSVKRPQLHPITSPPPNTREASDFLSVVTAISQAYSRGNYLRMHCLDRETWIDLEAGSTFQVSQSQLTFNVISEDQRLRSRKLSNQVVIKRIKSVPGFVLGKDEIETFVRELQVLHHMHSHPNVVDLRGVGWFYHMEDSKPCPKPVLILEHAPHTLDHLVHGDGEDPASTTKLEIFHDVAQGLRGLHECDIIHGDLKPGNVLIFEKERREGGVIKKGFRAKVSDFSLSLLGGGSHYERQMAGGTQYWTAPEANEMLSLEGLKRADIWSLGLLFGVVSSRSYNIIKVQDGTEQNVKDDARKVIQQVRSHFECSIESSAWETKLVILVRQLYLLTLLIDPTERDLENLLKAFESFLGLKTSSAKESKKSSLMPMNPIDLSVNYEAFKTLSGPLKDLMLENLKQIARDTEDPRRSKALFELAVCTLSKFASPDALDSEGIGYLFEAAHAGDVRAKALYHRIRQAHSSRSAGCVPDGISKQ